MVTAVIISLSIEVHQIRQSNITGIRKVIGSKSKLMKRIYIVEAIIITTLKINLE